MMRPEDPRNDELYSANALQNAQSILEARARAEAELLAAKEELQRRTYELTEERRRLEITLASIGDAVICTDAEGRVTFLNPVAESLTGWTSADAAGRPLPDVFHIVNEATRRTVENPALRALQEGTIVGLANHTVLIARDGMQRPIDDSAAPIRDPEGRTSGAVLVFRDVTERKRAEVAQARLAAIVESSQDAIVSKALDGTILSWNAGAEVLFGYTPDEAIGRNIVMLIPPERRAEETEILNRLRRGERVEHFDTVRVRKDGRLVDISLTISPIRNEAGEVIAASKIARDITTRKQAERVLRENAERHRFFAELAAETQPLGDPDDLMAVTARRLAEHLEADRCAYAEVEDESVFVITGDSCRGDMPSIVGRWPVADFGPDLVQRMRANQPYVIHDVDTDPRAGEDLSAYRATQIRSVICVPLHKDGKFIAAMAVHQKAPRQWTAAEVSLVLTVADRCWEALERGRVSRSLRESEARYRTIVEATPECVMLVAADGTLLQMNRAGLAIVEAAPEEAIGQCVYDVIAPEDHDAFRAFNERVCGGEPGVLEFDIIGRRGARRHLETTAVPLPAPGGGFNQLAITRDVTQRRQAERDLEESRARLDYSVRLSGIGFWYSDLPFDVLNWDEKVKEHFWLPPDARVTIDTFYERLHPDDREPARQAIDAAIRRRAPYDVDYRTVHPDTGAIKWVRAMGGASFGPDGEPRRFDGVTVDMTARKLDEMRLARALENEQEHAQLFREVAKAALTIHSSGSLESVLRVIAGEARRILNAHQAVSSLIDEDGNSIVNTVSLSEKDSAWSDNDAPPRGTGIESLVTKTNRPMRLAQEELVAHPAWRNIAGEEPRRPPMRGWLAAPLVSRTGKNLGLIQLSDKETGEFNETDELVLLQLAHIASVAIENARLYEELRDQDRRKDEFLALLAHELRNPLAPLRNGLEIMRLAEIDDGAVVDVLGIMERQLEHMVRLIDDLLDVSRISRNKVELRRAPMPLSEALDSAIETTRPLIAAAKHRLDVSLLDEPIFVDGDVTRLSQVFGNILHNSAKYTEPGGRIELAVERRGDCVAVRVTDTGIGIPAASLPSIFDMFSQVDRSIERSTGGLGIGLALVKGLVEMHGGTVEAASEGEGRGSTFTVTLPVLDDDAPSQAGSATTASRTIVRARRRILVADDNRDAANSMANMLRLLGNEVRTAHDGAEAVEQAAEFRPDVILMDVGMPRLNGHDATRRIRQEPWGRGVVVIALTGWGQEADRARSQEAGCDGHLTKPVDPAILRNLLDELALSRRSHL